MRKVNLKDVEEQERKSPKGKFHKFVKDVSIALGRDAESLDRHGMDPVSTVARTNCEHSTQPATLPSGSGNFQQLAEGYGRF